VTESTTGRKALALISGGLDSQLAAKVVANQGLEVVGVNFKTGFSSEQNEELFRKVERDLGIDIIIENVKDEDYLEILKSPDHGYGSAINPCLDCRILVLKQAKELMKEMSADFIVTGEVLGQRPMTQRKDTIDMIRKKSTLGDRLLRPLSAKLLPPTLPEKEGWVDRERLLDIQGRSRQRQLDLAEKFGITNYSQPAGGCLLTEDEFGHRTRELFHHRGKDETEIEHIELLKYGRHFRLPDGAKAVIGRNEEENKELSRYLSDFWSLHVSDFPGPLTLVTREATDEDLELAARLTARYSQGREEERLEVDLKRTKEPESLTVTPVDSEAELIGDFRIES